MSIGVVKIASVGFINSRPLIAGLDQQPQIELSLEIPSDLAARLVDQTADIALLPVIDYQRIPDLRIIPSGGIGCYGETLTVRLFSKKPFQQTDVLACDTDSHTSVALARIVFTKLFKISPIFIPLNLSKPDDARLLIGDKVVCEEPVGFAYQLDLGEAWKRLTGLPFVFAVWTARNEAVIGNAPELLIEAKQRGLARVDQIVQQYAIPRGWPADLARKYYTQYLKYDIGETQLQAIRLFHQYAYECNVLNDPVRPLVVVE